MNLKVVWDATNDVCEISVYQRLVKTVFRRRKQRFRPKWFYLEYTGRFKSLNTWGIWLLYLQNLLYGCIITLIESSRNVMAHDDAREGKWRGNWRMEWVTSTLHTTSEHGVSSITTADAYTSAASSRRNWRPCRFKWTRPFRRKTKSGFCACAITFQTQSTSLVATKAPIW